MKRDFSFASFPFSEEGNFLWIGTSGGLVKFDKTTEQMHFLTKSILVCLRIVSIQLPLMFWGGKWQNLWKGSWMGEDTG